MKKLLAMLLVLAMVMGLAACGGDPASTTSALNNTPAISPSDNPGGNTTPAAKGNFTVPTNGYDGSDVTITFYHTMGSNLHDVLVIYIEEFNKLYPNIHIQEEQVGGYDDVRDQISTQITVGNQPNIAYCYPDHVALYNLAKAVATLDDLIDSKIEVTRADGSKEILGLTDEQKADFIEGYYNEGRQFGDGLMYTMPFSKSTEVLYYNKTFFDEHNLTLPKTWDEMEELCKQIKAIDPNSIPLGYDSEANWFITMCEQLKSPYTSATEPHYVFDNDTNKAFVKKFRSWYQNGLMTTQTIYGAYTSGLFVAESGTRSYMSIGSSAGATHQRPTAVDGVYPFDVGITTIPQADASNPKVISQGPSVCIFQKSNPQEVVASWLFVKFLTTSVEFQAEFSIASGYVPVLKSVQTVPAYADFLNKADGGSHISALSAKVCLEQVDAYYTSPAFNGSSRARTEVGKLMSKCFSSPASNEDKMIADAFEDAVDECEYGQ
ncbi:MAG: extracellular solute-binding protein [Lachnospiraceae bacterium]|nr:extracellular solute-binding protein [Lachnospiraceae bacterium]